MKIFYIILFFLFFSCKNSDSELDNSYQNIVDKYEENYGLSVKHKKESNWDFELRSTVVSEKDSLTDLWKSNLASEYLEINEINDKSVNFLLRFMDVSKGGVQIKKGRANIECEDCPLEIKNTNNNYYHVKKYIFKNDSFGIILRMDTLWKTKAFAEYYE